MDFHNLSRKELQALCKKNMIPANMTNVAMANALAAMDKVEGLDEFINPPKSDPQNSPERTKQISTEPESSQPLTRTRRTTRRAVAGDVTLPETPAVPASRRRAVVGQDKSGLAQTPAVQSSRQRRASAAASAQRKVQEAANSARRSVRLLDKSMSKLGLMDKGSVEPVKVDGLSEEVEDVPDENNNVSGAPIAALSPKIEKTLGNEDSLNGDDSSVDNAMETEKPSMHNVLDTAKLSHGVLWEASDSSNQQSLLEDFSNQKLEAKDEPRGEYNANDIIHSVATAPCAASSPENKKSLLNSEHDSFDGQECGDSSVAIIETEQPSIVNVTDVAPPQLSSEGKSNATNDLSENHTEISEDSNATNDEAEAILDLHKEGSIIETEQPSIVNLTGVPHPELSSEGKSNATNDLSENRTEISEDSNATTNDQAEAILDLHKEGSIIETEQPSIVNFTGVAPPELSSEGKSNATNDLSENHTEISEDSNATSDQAEAIFDLHKEGSIIETEQPSIVNLTGVAPPELSSEGKSDATDDLSENRTEISEDSNATTNDQAEAILDLHKEEGSDSNPALAESEYTETSDFSDATNYGLAAAGEAPLNCSSIESTMESFVGVSAIEDGELDKTSWDSDRTHRTSETVVDVKEMTEKEEFSAVGRKTSTPSKQTSPCKVSSPNATTINHGAAGGNIEAPLNSSSTESQMERFDGVDATGVEEPLSCDSDKTPRTYETCVDVKEMPTEADFSAAEERIKQASPPCAQQQPLAASVSSSPFAEGTLQGQFPRPSQTTAKTTSSAKKLTTILAGINKENIDYGRREVELKREIKEEKPSYDAMSLRMLRKKLKEMQIVNKSEEHAEENSTKQGGKRRMALQVRPENCMHAAAEQQPLEKA